MTSPLPPRRRDTRDSADLIRQLKQNARQLGGGMVGGRWAPAKPLGATAQLGDLEDDDPLDDDLPAARNTDQATATTAGQVSLSLTYEPIDGSLLVFWGGTWQPPTEYALNDRRVTFTNPGVRVGHVLSAAYWYYPTDAVAPTIDSPANGSTIRDTTPTISGTGAEGQTITAYVDGVSIGTDVVTGGVWSVTSSALSAGAHTATATSSDEQEANSVDFTVATSFALYMASLNPDWWGRLGEASGTTAHDASGNARDATATSITFGTTGLVTGDSDTAATWSAPGRVEVPYGSWMDGSVISAFILFKTTSTDANGVELIGRWTSNTAQVFALDVVVGALRLRMGPAFLGTTTITVSGLGLNDGNKHMAGFTYDGATVKLYTEAGLVHSQAVSEAVTGVNTTLLVGADRGGASGSLLHHFAGPLDEPAYWANRLITAAEYADLWSLAS